MIAQQSIALRFAAYTQHTEVTAYYSFNNSTYLVRKNVCILIILKYKNLYDHYLFMKSINTETTVLWKPTITNKAAQGTYSFFISSFNQIVITWFCAQWKNLVPW